MEFDYDLWPKIQYHYWKYRPRTKVIELIQLHATRSGQVWRGNRLWNMDDERQSASNWFTSEGNRVPDALHEAAMCNVLVGNGTITRVLPDNMTCHHSLGHADATGLSLEICQPKNNVPFLEVDLRLAAEVCAEWSALYNIPIKVLSFLSADNHEGPGEVRHDRSSQGVRVGKTDPGIQFPSDEDWEAMVRGGNMSTEQNRQRMNKAAVLQYLAAMALADSPITELQRNWGRLVVESLRRE